VGCLSSARQIDTYKLPLQTGQQVVISAEAPSLDLPTVPIIRLIDPHGAVVEDVAQSGPERDALITHAAEHEGIYRLIVRDRYRHGGDRYYYRLAVRPDEADFQLAVGSDSLVIRPEQPAELPVTIKRRSASGETVGPISIEVIDLPVGVTVDPVTSETDGPTAEKVSLRFWASGLAYSGPVHIRGLASQPRDIRRYALTPSRLGVSMRTVWLTVYCP
jgi:hypothetical protein